MEKGPASIGRFGEMNNLLSLREKSSIYHCQEESDEHHHQIDTLPSALMNEHKGGHR